MTETHKQMLINEQFLTVRKIGEGGFGAVWKAYDFSLRNFVAIKELLKEYNEAKYVEMFYREALIAKNIIHDNVVRVQHFWRGSNGSFYISMDYVLGRDLSYLSNKCNRTDKKLSWELAVHICGCILKALDYANRVAKDPITGKPYGIVYRDISPGNIMISFDGGVKLSDFGIAKTEEDLNVDDKRKVITGKYGYMSPEQAQGDSHIDHRSDIFSIGVVLYELLAGKPLFSGDAQTIKTQLLETKFNPADISDMSIPDDLIEVIAKALQKDRENRYEKAIEMFRDLRRLLKGKESEELTQELSNFVNRVMSEELAIEDSLLEEVRTLSLQDVKNNQRIEKIVCKDFIVGESDALESDDDIVVVHPTKEKVAVVQAKIEAKRQEEIRQQSWEEQIPEPKSKGEEKGKTVFEEVGDWLVNKFKAYKRRLKRLGVALVIAYAVFFVCDIYLHITPVGRRIYSRLYPPDVVITTIPEGARVSVRTRDGKIILSNADSDHPIELRKIVPKTYIISAEKEGFKPIERIVRIEELKKGRGEEQKIEIVFDFPVIIDSEPRGADVYIDGNKLKATPWKGELSAGEHTVRLVLNGFEELGSIAKEAKPGQCNLDLARVRESDIFNGVDPNFWTFSVTNTSGEKVFNLVGHPFKKFNVDSNPRNILVHVQGEGKARGVTPITIPLKAGEYSLRFLDAEGRYEETTKTVKVDKDSNGKVFAELNKWITVKIRAKNGNTNNFETNLKMSGNGIRISRTISSAKPLRLALPVGAYKIVFEGNSAFKPLTLEGVSIAKESNIIGELEHANPIARIVVKDEDGIPVSDAYVWMQNKLVGKTNKAGLWKSEVEQGRNSIRIVSKGYNEKTIEKSFNPGEEAEVLIPLSRETLEVIPASSTFFNNNAYKVFERKLEQDPVPDYNNVGNNIKKPDIVDNKKVETNPAKQNIIICSNCGKIYIIGTKKPRFCTNCGKPFK